MNIYETCPVLTTPRFTLLLVCPEDAEALLRVYSDPAAQRCFNADNCQSDFRYTTLKEMEDCIAMWLWSYQHGHFVRWTVLQEDVPVGTVEMFRRDDAEGGTGVLRIDLHSRLETTVSLTALLEGILPAMHDLFGCRCILTKSTPEMGARSTALVHCGFTPHITPHYWARHQPA